MAVIAVWQCDRDGTMFQDKKQAEEYDKMLELAESISVLVERAVPAIEAGQSEAIGLYLAKHREILAKACKGKPELLMESLDEEESADDEDGKITPIKAKG